MGEIRSKTREGAGITCFAIASMQSCSQLTQGRSTQRPPAELLPQQFGPCALSLQATFGRGLPLGISACPAAFCPKFRLRSPNFIYKSAKIV